MVFEEKLLCYIYFFAVSWSIIFFEYGNKILHVTVVQFCLQILIKIWNWNGEYNKNPTKGKITAEAPNESPTERQNLANGGRAFSWHLNKMYMYLFIYILIIIGTKSNK